MISFVLGLILLFFANCIVVLGRREGEGMAMQCNDTYCIYIHDVQHNTYNT